MRCFNVFVLLFVALLASPSFVAANTAENVVPPKVQGESFVFESEVSRLMNLIINSLYKSKDIFLRELISNASDALDKIRFLSLTDKTALELNPHLNITIVADKEAKTLTITDGGVGMTRKELKENLGTIAKSGTSEFMTALENKTADIGLIGQFGVGFYSAFLIADSVSVVSKNNKDEQYIWTSTASKDFTIAKDPRGNTLGRGTQIVMYVKDDSLEYLEQDRLKSIIQKYSEFMNFPIFLWSKKTYTEEVPVEEEKKEEKEEDKQSDVEDVSEEKEKTEKPKTKTVTKTKEEWEQMNTNKPLWTRDPKEVKEQEYVEFYKAFTKGQDDPLSWSHFRAEGDAEFKSLLFVPESPPQKLFSGEEDHKNIKVFVKRVLVTDHVVDFLPRWLNFLKGLVDCDDIPINVSRETLQQHSVFNVMKKKITGKAIALFKKLANDPSKSEKFFKNYGPALKVGAIEDQKSQKKLLPLLRFPSSASANLTGFDDYISRMKKNQTQIFYLTGTSLEEIKASPFVERVIGRGYEVLFLDQPIDEYLLQAVTEYKGTKLQSVAKKGLVYGDESEESKKMEEEQTEEFKPLTEKIKTLLDAHISEVVLSNRLTSSPCAVVAQQWALSGTMERIIQSQPTGKDDFMKDFYLKQKKIFEINPAHPIMKTLLEKVKATPDDKEIEHNVQVLFEVTMLRSGYSVKDMTKFARNVENVVRSSLGVDKESEPDIQLTPAPEKTQDSTEKIQDSTEKANDSNEKTQDSNEKANDSAEIHDEL